MLFKFYNSNLSEVFIWKKCPNNYPEVNNRVWVLKSFIVSIAIVKKYVKNNNLAGFLRFLTNPISVLGVCSQDQNKFAQPAYIEGIVDELS